MDAIVASLVCLWLCLLQGGLLIVMVFLRERTSRVTSGDLLRCRRALVRLERGAVAQSKLKFPIERDNSCELGELAKSAHGSALNRQ